MDNLLWNIEKSLRFKNIAQVNSIYKDKPQKEVDEYIKKWGKEQNKIGWHSQEGVEFVSMYFKHRFTFRYRYMNYNKNIRTSASYIQYGILCSTYKIEDNITSIEYSIVKDRSASIGLKFVGILLVLGSVIEILVCTKDISGILPGIIMFMLGIFFLLMKWDKEISFEKILMIENIVGDMLNNI